MFGRILVFLFRFLVWWPKKERLAPPQIPGGLASEANKLTRLMEQVGHQDWLVRQYHHPNHKRDMDRVLARARRLVKQNEPLEPLFDYLLRAYGLAPADADIRPVEFGKRTGGCTAPLAAA